MLHSHKRTLGPEQRMVTTFSAEAYDVRLGKRGRGRQVRQHAGLQMLTWGNYAPGE